MSDNIQITAGLGTTVATDDVGGVHYSRIKRSVGGDGSATDYLDKASQSRTATTTGAGTTVDVSAQSHSRFAIQVVPTGSVTSWTVTLDTSLDGSNFKTVLTHTDTGSGSGAIEYSGAAFYPSLYWRTNVSALTLGAGTNLVITAVSLP